MGKPHHLPNHTVVLMPTQKTMLTIPHRKFTKVSPGDSTVSVFLFKIQDTPPNVRITIYRMVGFIKLKYVFCTRSEEEDETCPESQRSKKFRSKGATKHSQVSSAKPAISLDGEVTRLRYFRIESASCLLPLCRRAYILFEKDE